MSRPIRGFEDAELAARDWLREVGFADAEVTGQGADGGVDVRGSELVAQVKAEMKPIGGPVIQQIFGIATAEEKLAACFALSGFTNKAVDFADRVGVALFRFNYEGEVEPANVSARALATVIETVVPPEPVSEWIQLGIDFPPGQEGVTALLDQWGVGKPEVVWSVSETETLGWLVSVEPNQVWPSRSTSRSPSSGPSPYYFWARLFGVDDWPFEVHESPQEVWEPGAMDSAYRWEVAEKDFSGAFDTVEEAFRVLDRLYSGAGVLPSDYDLEYRPRMSSEEHMAVSGAGHDRASDEELSEEMLGFQMHFTSVMKEQLALLDSAMTWEAERFEWVRAHPTSTGYDAESTRVWLNSWCHVRQTVRRTLDIAKDCERVGLPFMLDRTITFMALVLFEPTLGKMHEDVSDVELAAMFNRRVEIESVGAYEFVAHTDDDDADYFRRNTSMIG